MMTGHDDPRDDGDNPDIGRRRQDRQKVGLQGRYRRGSGVPKDVWITDLSQTGCRFYDRFGTMKAGTPITLRLGTFGPIPAVVRWWDNQVNGVEFVEPLHISVFEHMCTKLSDKPPADLDFSRL
ncbi:PilZ domain-containing protein [Erythrobacteraceae bacterium WH01K]|nr:PilZ domain-containing protein [Erythrobacteraceae bacterium WH01K]